MSPDLRDTTWMQCGVSILWDADALNELCPADSVRSLRELLRLYEAGWPEEGLNLISKRTLVISGLEAAMDTLSPDEAVEWLEQKVYPAIRTFQDSVADGGGEAALIFWFADQRRLVYSAADNTHHWHCAGQHRAKSIPIGRCIWNGAESSVRKIVASGVDGKQRNIGLFLRRIS
jgi:hypothetical protein